MEQFIADLLLRVFEQPGRRNHVGIVRRPMSDADFAVQPLASRPFRLRSLGDSVQEVKVIDQRYRFQGE